MSTSHTRNRTVIVVSIAAVTALLLGLMWFDAVLIGVHRLVATMGVSLGFVAVAASAHLSTPAAGGMSLEDDPTIDADGEPQEVVELQPPKLSGVRFGVLGELWALRKHRKKLEKLANKGYVRWYLLDDTFPEPKFVKPERTGAGVWEYEHDGVQYIFSRKARLPSREHGLWTVMHRRGEADPINLKDPAAPPIEGDRLREYLDTLVTKSPPGFLDGFGFDLDPKTLIYGAIGLIIVVAALQRAGVM